MEDAPKPCELAGMTLAEWHTFLITDEHTQEDQSHLAVPASRYGRDAADTAWWAVAALAAYEAAGGDMDESTLVAQHMMSMAVNDHSDLVELVWEYEHALPPELLEQLYGSDR